MTYEEINAVIAQEKREKKENWRDLAGQPVYLDNLPAGWRLAVIPSFASAAARFVLHKGEAQISVYLDTANHLGCFEDEDGNPAPYWEVYPVGDDVGRVPYADNTGLADLINQSAREQESK